MEHRAFRPQWWLRSTHSQSILPSLPVRRLLIERRTRGWRRASRELLLDCGDGVTLQAFHSSAAAVPSGHSASPLGAPALAVLLHGWEGSADSQYILSLADALLAGGCDVIRLNLRDHGDTHHLNRDLFHSCRLPEVVGAVQRLQELFPARRRVLIGYSLGGNFMLRVAAEAPRAGLDIDRVIAVSALLDPATTLDAIENGLWIYHSYFVMKWTRSLLRKQAAWPDIYRFGTLLRSRNLRRMTEDLVLQHTDYRDLHSYLRDYAITGDRLAGLTVPSTIVTALDDPMIAPADLQRLATSPALRVVTTPTGGHCGFLEDLGSHSWIDDFILRELQQAGIVPRMTAELRAYGT
jgi:predicted alpha/beta-fold hydrolase